MSQNIFAYSFVSETNLHFLAAFCSGRLKVHVIKKKSPVLMGETRQKRLNDRKGAFRKKLQVKIEVTGPKKSFFYNSR